MKQVKLCLDKYLNSKDVTRYWLAKRTGIHITTLGKYYKNTVVKYDSNLLSRICTALNCDISDIIECINVDE